MTVWEIFLTIINFEYKQPSMFWEGWLKLYRHQYSLVLFLKQYGLAIIYKNLSIPIDYFNVNICIFFWNLFISSSELSKKLNWWPIKD